MLTQDELNQIEQSVSLAEMKTSGEIRVHIDSSCETDAYKRGLEIFQELEMHKTELRNGILIYIDFTHRKIAVIGDKGIHSKVNSEFWVAINNDLIKQFKTENFLNGILQGVKILGEKLEEYFPRNISNADELSNKVTIG